MVAEAEDGILAGHDYCDGERPEGDFFVQTALKAFLGVVPASCPASNLVFRTYERDRYVSFFVYKTPELDAKIRNWGRENRTLNIDPAFVYPRFSPYFSMWWRLLSFGRRKIFFHYQCAKLCGFDCSRRLRALWPKLFEKKLKKTRTDQAAADQQALACAEFVGTETGWLILYRTGFRPVSDQFQTSAACRICGVHVTVSPPPCPVHVTVSCPMHSVMLDAQCHVGCTVSFRMHSVISDMHLS